MNKLKRAFARVGRASIWAPGAIPPDEIKYAGPLKRVALPVFDLLLIVGGIYAVSSGIPALDTLLPDAASNALGIIFVVCAVVCLFGAAFPRLWPVEMGGKILIVSILGMYFFALRLVDGGTPTRLFVSAAVVWGLVLPVLRLWYLGVEYAGRHNRGTRQDQEDTK
jgi:hypothetical protein